MALITLGLFVQVVLADGALAPTVVAVFSAANPPGLLDSWLGIIALTGRCLCGIATFFSIAAGFGQCLVGIAQMASWPRAAEALLSALRWLRLVLRWEFLLAVAVVLFPARSTDPAAVSGLLRGLIGANRDAVALLPTILIAQTLVAAVAVLALCAQFRHGAWPGLVTSWPEWALGGVWGLMLFVLIAAHH